MKGLLLKDLINFRRYSRTMLIMVVFYAVFAYTTDNPSMISAIITLIFSMMTITSFAFDDAAKWDRYALSMPVSRRGLVMSKYVLGVILTVLGMVLAIACALAVGWITGGNSSQWSFAETVVTGLVVAEVALLFISILLPMIYRFGVEKSRMLMMLVFAIPGIAAIGLMRLGVAPLTEQQLIMLLKFSPAIVAALLAASYSISLRIYAKKEL